MGTSPDGRSWACARPVPVDQSIPSRRSFWTRRTRTEWKVEYSSNQRSPLGATSPPVGDQGKEDQTARVTLPEGVIFLTIRPE